MIMEVLRLYDFRVLIVLEVLVPSPAVFCRGEEPIFHDSVRKGRTFSPYGEVLHLQLAATCLCLAATARFDEELT
jgi:hypothetical protein